ncbi:MAG: imidazole glycerol phosphate synthase subunit HisH [Clostridia bacterium]|nr:imidazole glycerol phosphate synthase subunit HisH [Clostridia bacterium]
MIAIIDYGVGNLFSLQSSFAAIGAKAVVTADPTVIRRADRILLPGVGAFKDAARKLEDSGMAALVREQAAAGKPIMGICLGMQLLLDVSYEYGEHKGLGLIEGKVVPIRDVVPADYKVPHIGWNGLHLCGTEHPLFKYVQEGDCVYFVHSYYATDCPSVIATTEYHAALTAAVAKDNVMGCQFHPEKSGDVGLNILRAFCEMGGTKNG